MISRRLLIGASLSFVAGAAKPMVAERAFDPKSFPYPVVTVDGARALGERKRLSARGVAIVIGNDEQAARVVDMIQAQDRSPQDILNAAAALRFPQDWVRESARQEAEAIAFLASHPNLPKPHVLIVDGGTMRDATPDELKEMDSRAERGPDVGVWPDRPEPMQFGAATSYKGPELTLHIAILPTQDPTEAPAYLRFGGWNACPPPEYHVAALRRWRSDFGANLVTCSADQLELTVERRPGRDAALALARDQYAYCNDIIDQGFATFSALAASLTVSDWWSFWWD